MKYSIDIFSAQRSFSQEGEDLILNRFLNNQIKGFYVDIGAHHPVRFSNTNLFYKRDWRGVNIDAMPGSMKLFSLFRRHDTNIECGVAAKSSFLTYYRFNESALNTFDANEDRKKDKAPYKLIGVSDIRVERLDVLLTRYLSVFLSLWRGG
jgi:hypothetical protein